MTTLDAEIRYYTAEEVAAFHNGVMESAPMNPSDAVRDWNLLESVVTRPRMAAYYEEADLLRQAATLLWGLSVDATEAWLRERIAAMG